MGFFKKKLSERDNWLLWEISALIEMLFRVKYSESQLARLLRSKLNAKFSKPYPKDYRQSPYYKQSFHLKLNPIFKKYNLKYDIQTKNIINMDTNEPFLIFSFDESSFQFTANNVKFWALIKPLIERDTDLYKCKAMGVYSLTPEGNDYLQFVENYKSETVISFFEKIREKNPVGTILLLVDNLKSHKTTEVKNKAKELNIELCYLPTYSPQLQPIEKIWKANKREIGEYKVTSIFNYKELKKDKRKKILESIISDSFYNRVENKNKWNKVLNNYIIPKIKLYSPEFNEELVVQKC